MALIRWQTNAKRHLKSLFDYYRDHASEAVALSLQNTIMDNVEKLEAFPTMGIKDDESSASDEEGFKKFIKRNIINYGRKKNRRVREQGTLDVGRV